MRICYLNSYLRYNLGDDLFLKIILERYPEITFVTKSPKSYNIMKRQYKNLIIINNKINKLLSMVTLKKYSLEKKYLLKAEAYIMLGGSLFIENAYKKKDNKFDLSKNIKTYVIGSNFGPYYSKDYYDKHFKFFKNCEDVCFREKKSYNLFADLNNVRCASDVVFSLSINEKLNRKFSKRVIISVIDCSKRDNIDCECYDANIVKLIEFFKSHEYNVTLMSFCKFEGDENAINRITKKISSGIQVDKYFYDGNVNEAIDVINDCEIVVGSRFHANILGFLLNKVVIPIAYSDKTINVLNDLKFEGVVFDCRNSSNFELEKISTEALNYKLNIFNAIKDSDSQFEFLDEILMREGSFNEI